MQNKIVPCLWFDGDAEEAARFYAKVVPGSSVGAITRSPADNPSMKAGGVLTVDFTVAGMPFVGLNGGPRFKFNEAVSFQILCDDQAEVDRLWDAFTKDGGEASQCGWLKDRFGLSWQIVPRVMDEMYRSPDREKAKRAMEAMLQMKKLDIAALQRAFDGR